ncbi:deaminase [Roseixanthobacter liquoris]|uniref:deaminase n=1 Tax=Roseixanthobacter liquoris TaxID=3119921 RepID=UPI00372A9AAD
MSGEKKEITFDLLGRFIPDEYVNDILKNNNIKEAQIMDALEYGRITHAEMSAICDAARTGRSVKSGTLFSTTFPCHMCAKHIVSAGLSKVIFLEPYPKSLASDLHSDSIQIENNDRGQYSKYPAVSFEHFYGVSPRRYREIFERSKRKSDDGQFQAFIDDERKPFIDIKIPVYGELEKLVIEQFGDRSFIEKLDEINAG